MEGEIMKKYFFVLFVCSLLVAGEAAPKSASFWDKMPQADLLGKKIEYNKKVYLIDVWATWCPPCRYTIPELVSLQSAYADKKFTVIGISVDNDVNTVSKYMYSAQINYPLVMDNDLLKNFPPVRGIPTLFLMNKDGKIVKTFVGYTPAKTLASAVEKELK
jgi:thiol-disulfide isomerase/thioredoxin